MIRLKKDSIDDATAYMLFKSIEKSSETTQRKLAAELGVSNGKINYLLCKMSENGWLKVLGTTSNRYGACLYKLTPAGIEEKASATQRYLQSLQNEQNALNKEIETLQSRQQIVNSEIEALSLEAKRIDKNPKCYE